MIFWLTVFQLFATSSLISLCKIAYLWSDKIAITFLFYVRRIPRASMTFFRWRPNLSYLHLLCHYLTDNWLLLKINFILWECTKWRIFNWKSEISISFLKHLIIISKNFKTMHFIKYWKASLIVTRILEIWQIRLKSKDNFV